MRRKFRLIALGCATLLALSLPAFSRPIQQLPAKPPLPTAKPKAIQLQAAAPHAAKQKPVAHTPAPAVVRAAPAPRAAPVEHISLSANAIKPMFGAADLVSEARKYMGTNPTDRARLWCATFMNFVLAKVGYAGTNSDAARSFAYYGRRISEPRVGAIAVLTRGKNGGHVGVVNGIDSNGNPIIISGNHNKRVGEAVYARSRVIAYVMPTERGAAPTMVAARGPVSTAPTEGGFESPITELLAAIEAEQARAEKASVAAAAQQRQPQRPASVQVRERPQTPATPQRVVQQTAESPRPAATQPHRAGSDPFSELFNHLERKQKSAQVVSR